MGRKRVNGLDLKGDGWYYVDMGGVDVVKRFIWVTPLSDSAGMLVGVDHITSVKRYQQAENASEIRLVGSIYLKVKGTPSEIAGLIQRAQEAE